MYKIIVSNISKSWVHSFASFPLWNELCLWFRNFGWLFTLYGEKLWWELHCLESNFSLKSKKDFYFKKTKKEKIFISKRWYADSFELSLQVLS